MKIEVKNLSFAYGAHSVLQCIDFSTDCGERIALLGPNGAGKSTLFQCLLGFLKPNGGEILLGGTPLHTMTRAEIARNISYIPQTAVPVFNHTVLDTVLMGFANQLSTFESPKAAHRERAMALLDTLGIAHLAARGCTQISGGERQLTLIARALAQEAKIILMDEPTANLDYGNAFRVMQRIEQLGCEGYTILFSTHEPNQAFRYATRVLTLYGGTILTDGAPESALSEETLQTLYRINVGVHTVTHNENRIQVAIPYETKGESK